MWALVHSEHLLATRLGMLRLQLSDSSLTQMPEFEQRVVVLQKLQYVSLDRTVLLKVHGKGRLSVDTLPAACFGSVDVAKHPTFI